MHMYRIPAVGIRSRSLSGFSSRNAVESGGGVSSDFFLAKTPKAANWSRIRALSNGEQRGEVMAAVRFLVSADKVAK